MKYTIILAGLLFVAGLLFIRTVLEEHKKKGEFEKQLYDMWGKLPAGYEKGVKTSPKGYCETINNRFMVDEITWNELDMEEVFSRMDYTCSQTGAEYLYAMLHCPAESVQGAERWEKPIQYFTEHPKERVQIQKLLADIGKRRGLSFFECIAEIKKAKKRSVQKEYFANLGYFVSALLTIYDMPLGLAMTVVLMAYQMVSYFRERAQVLPRLKCIAMLLRMTDCIKKLEYTLNKSIQQEIEQILQIKLSLCINNLQKLRKHSFWVLQCGRENSSPLSLIGDYIRMLFHADIIQFIKLERQILESETEIEKAAIFTGFVDSCISIAMYRASLERYCIPKLREGNAKLDMGEGYHPLLKQPITNSICVDMKRGVLLTGSNASGKSTFLKTVAINLLLAQTIHTALAEEFSAPISRIYTAMGAQDSIQKGESSYMAEILSLKRILDAEKYMQNLSERKIIFCFVDEVLRGTNTVERIAASTEILKYFHQKEIHCFAATHDRELTELLEAEYDNYHFTEKIQEGDIFFSYKLLSGCADSSNAIALLVATGYDDEITTGAAGRVEEFFREKSWK